MAPPPEGARTAEIGVYKYQKGISLHHIASISSLLSPHHPHNSLTMYGGGYGRPPPPPSGFVAPPMASMPSQYGRQPPQGPGGFAFQQPGPPPGADPQLWRWFSSVDEDRSGTITVTELQTALINGMFARVLCGEVDVLTESITQATGLVSDSHCVWHLRN